MAKNIETKTELPIRDGFGDALVQLGDEDKNVVALCADLTSSVRMSKFSDKYPDRFFQVGIAEQNMAGVAAGLALSGKIPFMGSFASFQPMRNLDQIRTSIAMMNAPVKIISSHAGFSHAADGIQVEALEDIAIMRVLPNMTVFVPADSEQANILTHKATEINGPVYIRLGRSKTPVLSKIKLKLGEKVPEIQVGKAQIIRRGTDVLLIASGYMVMEAFKAAREMTEQGISVGLLNIHTIKPLDIETIGEFVKNAKAVVTVEEHQVAGGLGSAIAEDLIQKGFQGKLRIMGVDDSFGETAKQPEELWKKFGLTSEDIVVMSTHLLNM